MFPNAIDIIRVEKPALLYSRGILLDIFPYFTHNIKDKFAYPIDISLILYYNLKDRARPTLLYLILNYSASFSSAASTTSSMLVGSSETSSWTSSVSSASKDSPCLPSMIAFAIVSAINLTALIASSFPGIT